MLAPAYRYLTLRSLGAPAVLLSLAMQGVFRGFKDTKTPLYATVAGDVTNIILDPILIFVFRMGVSGAAIAHVISQYLITLILLCRLVKQVDIIPPSVKALKFGRFLKCGVLLLARVIAVTFCVTLAASLAAHHGPTTMAAFQVCLQLWLATSLLADGLAVAGQAILASAFARGDYRKAVAAASGVLQLSIVLGLALSVLIGVGMQFGSRVFYKGCQWSNASTSASQCSRVAASDEEHISKYTTIEMEQAVLQTEEKMRQEMHLALERAEKRHQDQMRQQLERADQRHQKQMQALATGLLSKLGLPSTTFELPHLEDDDISFP